MECFEKIGNAETRSRRVCYRERMSYTLPTRRFLFSLVTLVGLPLPVNESRGNDSINVMSWNIRYDNPRDGKNNWKHRKDWVAEIIARERIDIAGLQEVLHSQLADLKKRLPDWSVYGVGPK